MSSKSYDVDPELWAKINFALCQSTPGVAQATMIIGMCTLMQATGEAEDADQARVMLAAMILSPADRHIGALADKLPDELAKLRGRRWLHS